MLHPSSAGLPSVSDISAAVLASLSQPDAPEPSTTSDALVALSALHGARDLGKALSLLERQAVSLFVGEPSGRRSATVGSGGGGSGGGRSRLQEQQPPRHTTLVSSGFCSCESFFFDVVGRGDKPACKHLLAAELAGALAGAAAEAKRREERASADDDGGGESARPQRRRADPPPSSPLAPYAPKPTVVPDDVLARLLIAG